MVSTVTRTADRRRRLPLLLIACLLALVAGAAPAAPPAGYYDTVDTSSPAALRASLHAIIQVSVKIPYTASSTDTWDVLEQADQDPLNPAHILDVYRNRSYAKYGGGNNYYNREHTWPKSYGFPDDGPSNKPYTDCHHLFLCDIGYNSDRGNRVYDWCTAGCTARPADSYAGASGTNYFGGSGPGEWETWLGRCGDVARALLYMDVRYEGDGGEPDLRLTDDLALINASATGNNEPVAYMGLLSTLLEWHRLDPVDDKERARNDAVYTYQHNRNPFIDHPEWVAVVWYDEVGTGADALPPVAAAIVNAYPNPFNPVTTIAFTVPVPVEVDLAVYAADGRRVRWLGGGSRAVGEYRVTWDGRDDGGRALGSGVYFCRLRAGGRQDVRRLVLIK